MRKLSKKKPLTKSRRARRLVFLVLLGIVLLGIVGLVSRSVLQAPVQEGTSEIAQTNNLPSASARRFSNAATNTDKPGNPSAESSEKGDSRPGPATSQPGETDSDELPFDRQEALAISGTVMDDGGTLLPNILVMARPANQPGSNQDSTQISSGVITQVTDQLGGFTFSDLDEGEYELAVEQDEQHYPALQRVRAGVANAELVLQRIRSVTVYGIVSDETGNPLEGVRIQILGENALVRSDPTGAYSIQAGPSKAGQAPVIDFSLRDYRETRERVEGALNTETDEVQLNVKMERDSNASKVAVSGRVSGPTGEPVDGAGVWLSSSQLQTVESTRSSTSGEYRFNSIETGDAYVLGVDPVEGYTAFRSDPLSIGPGDFYYDVTLDAAGFSNLSGTVTDLNGSPLRNFTLWLRSIDVASHPSIPVQTDGAGGFRLENIPAGAIELETRSQPWLDVTGIVLAPGQSRHVNLPLDWGRNWLLGQVVDDKGEPVSRAQVILRWTQNYFDFRSESRREVMSDQQGYFALSNLDAQEYILTVQAAGYESFRVQYQPAISGPELLVTLPRRVSMGQ